MEKKGFEAELAEKESNFGKVFKVAGPCKYLYSFIKILLTINILNYQYYSGSRRINVRS